MFLSYERSSQPDLVGAGIIVPIAGLVGSRDPGPSASVNILRRHSPKRQTFSAMDRLIFAGLYRLAPTVLNALAVLKPDTVIKWHRVGFRSYLRWKSDRRGGRPTLPTEIRKLSREIRF